MAETVYPNPCGIDGVEFIEFASTETTFFDTLFARWGFTSVARNADKAVQLFRQNKINFVTNCEPGTFAHQFAQQHGPSISATGFRFKNAKEAFKIAVERGARPYTGDAKTKAYHDLPAVYGIGDSLIYFVDDQNAAQLYQQAFAVGYDQPRPKGFGFEMVDHFTNNVPVGEMQKWCDFYTQVFGFRETRFFDVRGEKTGLISKVMRSPCSKFAVPINEPTDKKSQIQEYLNEYKGSGIQHLAMITKDILVTLKDLQAKEVEFLTPPPTTYYQMLSQRVPNITEDLQRLEKNAVLVDGDHDGYLLQIFSKNIIGPIFFEVIQRKNHHEFGEGNFQALFDAIERDQSERGYL